MFFLTTRTTRVTIIVYLFIYSFISIGYAIAKRLAEDGARVVISSRKQENVDKAVDALKALNLPVTGLVCHVGKPGEIENLLRKVTYQKRKSFIRKF